ncbi:hypothetical protein C8R43DRAFT_1052364 [Mycena crocata]|nr:hypothetical protein C8R43DRAFT_1052364 [Mycena crocata]
MQNVPVELIRHIFKLSVSSRDEAIANGKISLSGSPWSLANVCRLWRSIALDMPCLWTSLVVAIPPSTRSWDNYPIHLLRLQISRSGTLPLHVYFTSEEVPGWTTDKLFATIVQSCDRWDTLELRSTSPIDQSFLLQMRGNLPLLRELSVHIKEHDKQRGTNIFEYAPQLRVARVFSAGSRRRDPFDLLHHNPGLAPRIETAILPWAQLTTFQSTYDDLLQFDGIRLAQNLVECRISVRITSHLWQPPAQPTLFPHLRRLKLYAYQAPVALLDSLKLPSLESLSIAIGRFDGLVPLLQRSACSLQTFWTMGEETVEGIFWILMNNPEISELGLHGFGSSADHNDIIAALTLSPQQPAVYAPALTSLHLRDKRDLDLNAVFDMLDSREQLFEAHGCARLEAFSIVTSNRLRFHGPKIRARIEVLRNAGVNVEIIPEKMQAL